MINIQKSVAFLYTNNEISERKSKKKKKLSKNKIKYLGINLTKKMKDLYTDNCNILIKKIEDDSK